MQTSTGAVLTVLVQRSFDISFIKHRVFDNLRCPVNEQIIIYNGKTTHTHIHTSTHTGKRLKNLAKIADYLPNESVVQMLSRPTTRQFDITVFVRC
jgi:hypothetical protein